MAGDERIARVFAHGDGRDDETFGPPGGEVLIAVDGDVHLPGGESLLDSGGEPASAFAGGKGGGLVAIARGGNGHHIDG